MILLTDITSSVSVGELVSDTAALSCGVHQRSILGPILFSTYMFPLGQIIDSFSNIFYHLYTGDNQLYFYFKTDELYRMSILKNFLNAIRNWMRNNFLRLNADQIEVLVIAPGNLHSVIRQNHGALS